MRLKQKIAHFRFYAELNELLQKKQHFKWIPVNFRGRQSVKHLTESLGVPHTEIDLILVNSRPVNFSYIVEDGDRVSVYPMFETFNISQATRLRPKPLRETRFVLDCHLGRLAAYLRMMGFDTLYQNDFSDEELAEISAEQKRILLTRDRGLLKRDRITHGFLIRTRNSREQLLSVVRRFDLLDDIHPFTRCMACNGLLVSRDKEDIVEKLQPKTKKYFNVFKECEYCGRVFWNGSHHERMEDLIEWVRKRVEET